MGKMHSKQTRKRNVMKEEPNRRQFLKASFAGLAGLSLANQALISAQPQNKSNFTQVNGIPYRSFGKTRERVSLLSVGGAHIGRPSEREGIRIIQEAISEGVNFLDNAWEYHNGRSEERMGKALQRGRREKVFLMSKHHGRDQKTAMKHLEDSLRRLKTDYLDLWMFHECVYDRDPERIFAPGGGIEAAELAKQQGKVRYVGFTGHKWPRIHLKMLAYDYPWDAVLMPLNILDGSFRSFEKWVLPVLSQRGIAALAMKTRASGAILQSGAATVSECWRYVTALPVATIVSGMESLELLRSNLKMARQLKPMAEEEMVAITRRTQELALTGKYELFKTSNSFDGPVGRALYGL